MQHLTQQLSDQGQILIQQTAARLGFSPDAVTQMFWAVRAGQGSMAQFSHPEFGGSGQWMRSGMIMLGDMFNHTLKGQVDQLCNALSQAQADRSDLTAPTPGGPAGARSGDSFVSDWWPVSLGAPNAAGAQNQMRYAYFASARRLAVDSGGDVWVYDTLDHHIGGFSQQQGSGGGVTMSSQYGLVDLSSLPVVMRNGQNIDPVTTPPTPSVSPASSAPAADASDVFSAIERLGDLLARGLLTEQEFSAKKAELLSRL